MNIERHLKNISKRQGTLVMLKTEKPCTTWNTSNIKNWEPCTTWKTSNIKNWETL